MNKKTTGHARRHQATPKTSKDTCNSTGFAARIKAAIVTLAQRGWLPYAVAGWLIQRGGLRGA